MSASCNVPTHECIAPATGECACTAFAGMNVFVAVRGDKTPLKTVMWPLAKLFWTLIACLVQFCQHSVIFCLHDFIG